MRSRIKIKFDCKRQIYFFLITTNFAQIGNSRVIGYSVMDFSLRYNVVWGELKIIQF